MVSAQDVMEPDFPRVEMDTPLSKVIPLLKESSAVVVMDGRQYQGLLVERDIIRAKLSLETKAKTVLRHVPKLSPDTPAEEIARLIVESGVYLLPVLEGERMQGAVSADTLLREVARRDFGDQPIRRHMSSPVVTIAPEERLGKALKMFKERDISRLPVVDNGQVKGILTMDDVTRKVIHPEDRAKGWGKYGEIIAEKKRYLEMPVYGLMVDNPLIMPPEASVQEVIDAMIAHDIRGMLVGADRRVEGIVTKKDLLRPLAASARDRRQPIVIQFAGELDSIKDFSKEEAAAYLLDELAKHQRFLEVGELYVHLKQHKEVRQGLPLIYCKMRLSSPRGMFVAADEGWGFMNALRQAMGDIDRQIRKAGDR
ncbi:MAG: CBS domain-containing protein [Candidatus Thermoplasmatota archaeon]|nr:CBS domain-containing protein [Candidatus Thermoplasmatota archaeon]